MSQSLDRLWKKGCGTMTGVGAFLFVSLWLFAMATIVATVILVMSMIRSPAI